MMMINIKKDAFALRTFSHFQLSTFNFPGKNNKRYDKQYNTDEYCL